MAASTGAKRLKILLAGDWHSDIHEEPLARAWEKQGHEVICFGWHRYFDRSISSRAQNKFLTGPRVWKLNRDLLALARRHKPEMVFIYRGSHVFASTLRSLRQALPGVRLVGYNNDDPFSPRYAPYVWRHFVRSLPDYDLALAYRHRNLEDFKRAGAPRVELLRSWFLPDKNRPVELSAAERERFGADVSFVGHFENDGREKLIERLIGQEFDFKLFGPEWERGAELSPAIRSLGKIGAVRGEDYNKALCGTQIAICLLSKLNRDTYTRRCFEIPAAGTFMLAEYTEDLASLFAEGVEAEYFRDADELLAKIRRYLADDTLRRRIAKAGFERVWRDGHDVESRARQVVDWVQQIA